MLRNNLRQCFHIFRTKKSSNSVRFNSDVSKTVTITTPIFYVNSIPHIGHLYSCLIGDAIARWNRFKGNKTLFVTGTDEHGLKVQQAAEKIGKQPDVFCTEVSNEFRRLFDKAQISYDDYIRTTEDRHKTAVYSMWNILQQKGLIYLGKYEGWYCVPDESFLTEDQVKDVVDPKTGQSYKISLESGHRVEWVIEENYKFKLSEFKKPLLQWLENNNVIVPSFRSTDVKKMLENIDDISISRSGDRIKWALPVPNDPKHTIYVWLDALTNYLTTSGFPSETFKNHWPADYHIIGKDILKFHSIYWPAFLLGADLPLPKKIISHSYWTVNHVKMSKSLGNVVNPFEIIENFGLDPVRYFLLSNGGLSDDGDFTYKMLYIRLKGDLADNFGNLISRCTTAIFLPDNVLPKCGELSVDDIEFIENFNKLPEIVDSHFKNGNISFAIEAIMTNVGNLNKYYSKNEPWKLKKQADNQRLNTVMYVTLEGLRIVCLLLLPVMPESMNLVLNRLGVSEAERSFNHLKFGRASSVIDTSTNFKAFTIPDVKKINLEK